MDRGWSGPPFDPIVLAEILKIPLLPRDDIADARTVPVGRDGVRIEFNPNRPPNRVRYSIAHEIAHTLFPDCGERVRDRAAYHQIKGDEWQLEALCNVGAAEFLMPAGSLAFREPDALPMEGLLDLRREFAVSIEALLLRVVRNSESRCAAFCASKIEHGSHSGRYRVEYIVGSPTWPKMPLKGTHVPHGSVVEECVAIGFTAKGSEKWGNQSPASVECVGIPAYPGTLHPRVAGILRLETQRHGDFPLLMTLKGDATEPRGTGKRVVAHIVNDGTANWGGAGFAAAIRKKWPNVQQDFQRQVSATQHGLRLGRTYYTPIGKDTGVFHMVAQRGYGASPQPRIRYAALEACLEALADFSALNNASVHMPRIGTGEARGAWEIIRDIIIETVCAKGVSVTIYDPPSRILKKPEQEMLPLGPRI
jgi:O-acetyl-ADP-ribose deacetylase (regulator of RNase III)